MSGYRLTVDLTLADSQKAAREFVKRALQKTGWTTTKLAKEAKLAPSTLNRFMKNDPKVKHTLKAQTLSRIASVSGLPDPFEGVDAATSYVMPKVRVSGRGAEDLDVLGVGVGGDDGAFDLNGTVIDRVARPAILADVPGAYAIYMRGSSMSPKYEDGQLLYVNPHKPVRAGNYAVIEFTNDRAFVKRFVRKEGSRLVVEQLYPETAELSFDLATIRQIHKIVSSDEIG